MFWSARQQKDTTNARWPGCGAANINNGAKSKQTVYKELAASKKTPRKPKNPFWQTQSKHLVLFFELLTSHTHGQNSKQLVFQTNNATSSTCCQSKAWKFKHHHKKQHRENCNATVQDRSWRQHLSWRSASEDDECWQIDFWVGNWFLSAMLTENSKHTFKISAWLSYSSEQLTTYTDRGSL